MLMQMITWIASFLRQVVPRPNVDLRTTLENYCNTYPRRSSIGLEQACYSLLAAERYPMDYKDILGRTLHAAAEEGHLRLIRAIVHHVKGDPLYEILSTLPTARCAPLHQAAFNGHLQIVICLFDAVEPHHVVGLAMRPLGSRELPLHLATRSHHYGILSEILGRLKPKEQENALNYPNNDGETAIDIARRGDDEGTVACLEQFTRSSAQEVRNITALNDANEQLGQLLRIVQGREEQNSADIDDCKKSILCLELRTEELDRHGTRGVAA